MFQAIETKSHCPTDRRGSRVSATAAAGRVTLGWDHALNDEQNHKAAALALAHKFHWLPSPSPRASGRTIAGGQLKNGNRVWVLS